MAFCDTGRPGRPSGVGGWGFPCANGAAWILLRDLASLMSHHDFDTFHTAGLVGSVLGAVLLLMVGGFFSRRRSLA